MIYIIGTEQMVWGNIMQKKRATEYVLLFIDSMQILHVLQQCVIYERKDLIVPREI